MSKYAELIKEASEKAQQQVNNTLKESLKSVENKDKIFVLKGRNENE